MTIVQPPVFLRLFGGALGNGVRKSSSRDPVHHGDITQTRKNALDEQLKVESRPK